MKIRLKPISSAAPLLLFALAMVGAAAWLIGPVSSRPVLARTAPAPPPEPVLAPRRAELMYPPHQLTRPPMRRDFERLRRELETAETDARSRLSALEASDANLETIQAQIEALRAEIAALKAKRAALGPSRPTNVESTEADQLSRVVDQRREEVVLLETDLARANAPAPQADSGKSQLSMASAPVNKLPVPVELIHSQIAPLTRDFFKFYMSGRRPTYSATRSRRGETIEEAGKPDSLFGKFLSKLNPKREYLLLLVNADSFDSFYAVRELAMRAGVEVSWQPSDTSDGTIAIVHVVPASARHPAVIPLPDVVQ
jgi:hypothetical protein